MKKAHPLPPEVISGPAAEKQEYMASVAQSLLLMEIAANLPRSEDPTCLFE